MIESRPAQGRSARERFPLLAMLVSAGVAGAAIAAVSSLGFQIALVLGGLVCLLAFVLARRGTLLDAAFVIAGSLYLVGPAGTLVRELGLGISTLGLLVLLGAVFVVAALLTSPIASSNLYRLAPLLGLVAFGAVSIAWSHDPEYGLGKLAVWIVGALLPAYFVVVLASARGGVGWGIVLIAAVAAALALIVFGGTSSEYPGRYSLFGDNPIWIARGAFFGALVALFGPFSRTVKLVSIPFLVAAGILTVSLGPLLGLVAGVWAGWIAILLERRSRPDLDNQPGWVAIGLLSSVALVVLLADSLLGADRSVLSTAVLSDPNVIGRAVLLDTGVGLFLGAPLQGVGLGGFAAIGFLEYPHNLVVEIASELGLIGIILLAIWLVLAIRGAAGSPLLMALLVATTVFALFSGSVASNAEFWMVSALAVSGAARRREEAARDRREPERQVALAPGSAAPQ